jgi:hypothetical protein
MAKKSDRPRDLANDITGLVREGTKKWTRTVKSEERSPASRSYRAQRMTRERGVSFTVPVLCQWVFGGMAVVLSFVLYAISTFLNMTFWASLNPDVTAKMILATAGFTVEFSNYVIPTVLAFAPSSKLELRRRRPGCVVFDDGNHRCCRGRHGQEQPRRLAGVSQADQREPG